ncbi:MAG: hypothetical protein ACR2OB_07590 [Solirubrobacteraceae bacterium]
MNTNQFAALLGFAFAAAWIGFGLLDAILCLLGATIFYIAAAIREGEIDLAELQDRFGNQGARLSTRRGRAAPPPRPPRVE